MVVLNGKLLIVDDLVGETLKDYFTRQGYQTEVVLDGAEVMDKIEKNKPDVVILDVSLPHIDGKELCRKIRASYDMSIGIIMISEVYTTSTDRIVGLEVGADTYIFKPFETGELLAQVRAVLRRIYVDQHIESQSSWYKVDDYLSVHFDNREVMAGDKLIKLSAREFDLLAFFIKNSGKAFSRTDLIDKFWQFENQTGADDYAVNVFISRLRKKIEPDRKNPRYIIGVQGIGYKFKQP